MLRRYAYLKPETLHSIRSAGGGLKGTENIGEVRELLWKGEGIEPS